jgi:ankyrin repeat protein
MDLFNDCIFSWKLVQFILTHNNVNVNSTSEFGLCAISCAIYSSHSNVMINLIENGASLEVQEVKGIGHTPLMIACQVSDSNPNSIHITATLLRNHVGVNSQCKLNGWTVRKSKLF